MISVSKGYRLGLAFLTVGLCLVLSACAAPSRMVPMAQPMPDGGTFSGLWYSPQFEHMYLVQSGDSVRGVYAYREGGQLEGTLNGNLLKFEWTDPGNRQNARRAMKGHGYFQLIKDGDKVRIVGQWGHEDKYTGAGPWEAEFVRPIENGDPMTIEEIRRIH
jgi:hypothetical protein